MTTVHLARHGETTWHAENRYAGSSDVPLTARGREQGNALARWAAGAGVDVVATSDLSRAVETGDAAAKLLGVELVIDARLREVDFGSGEGRTRAEMAAIFPEQLAAFVATPASSPLPGGEPGTTAVARGLESLADLTRVAGADGTVLVVAHSTLIRLVLCRVLGLPLDEYRRRFPGLANTAVTTVELPSAADAAALVERGALIRFNAAL
ncbi:histidine phosphatase family protein [Agromyces sp. ISL-38]|uniref:histidine phosphatase family protein n=1 Tax=Agromyces sp. ISL-38 TaxID=2819107 RepID=UPI001BE62744|nr:histidine phosphatase family protein [Agromyces sp. ISL-38]MBT2497529.1 histidine phosphatase family protein [Agromyces sp. ISL-38]